MGSKLSLFIIFSLVIAIMAAGGSAVWLKRQAIQRAIEVASLPSAMPYHPVSPTPASTHMPPVTALPAEVNLAVPFTVQAPHANWSEPYGELCEEASVLMAISYIRHQTIPNPDAADQALLAIKAFEEKE